MILQWGTIPIAGGLVVAADAGSSALANAPIIGFLARERFALPFFFDALTFLDLGMGDPRAPARARTCPQGRGDVHAEGSAARDRARHDARASGTCSKIADAAT